MLSSTRIVIGAAVILGGGYFAYSRISESMAMSRKFGDIKPTKVSLIGIAPGAGYRIIVANSIAQLVQVGDKFGAKEEAEGGATEGAIKNRLPLREMMGALGGDVKALSEFVSRLNDMQENDRWPTRRIVWPAEKLRKALDGDKALEKELEEDLNVKLDGTPLTQVRRQSIESGIIVEQPVPIRVKIAGEMKTLTARVQSPYKPALISTVEKAYEEKPNITSEMIAGYYREEAKRAIDDPKAREDIRKALETKISAARAKDLAEKPERVLSEATIIINSDLITNASFDEYETPDGKFYNLNLQVNDEGRLRLWQYTKRHVGGHLLVVCDGVGIAAPRIQHELPLANFKVDKIRERRLVKEAVDILNSRNTTTSQSP